MALWRVGGLRPRVINVDGHPAYPTSNPGADGEWRTESSLPVSNLGVFEQCAGARSPIPEETNGLSSTKIKSVVTPPPLPSCIRGATRRAPPFLPRCGRLVVRVFCLRSEPDSAPESQVRVRSVDGLGCNEQC